MDLALGAFIDVSKSGKELMPLLDPVTTAAVSSLRSAVVCSSTVQSGSYSVCVCVWFVYVLHYIFMSKIYKTHCADL